MRKILIYSFFVLVMAACNREKSVIEPLNLDRVSELVSQDTLYEELIRKIDNVRAKLNTDRVLKSKYKDLTYTEFYEYIKYVRRDTGFRNMVRKMAKDRFNNQMDSLITQYKQQIDNKINYYRDVKSERNPSLYYSLEFAGITKEYYTSIDQLKEMNIDFMIYPLRGPIQGGSFTYKVISKVDNSEIANYQCRFSKYISSPKILTWEVPFDLQNEFEYFNTRSVREYYDFQYYILTARVNDETYNRSDLLGIPHQYVDLLEKDTLNKIDYVSVIELETGERVYYETEIFSKILSEQGKKINKTAFEFARFIY